MAKNNDPKYTVGYRKPPKQTRFKPGQSGNPNGRPRKIMTFGDDVDRELRSTITVEEGGIRQRMTKSRAMAKQHVNRALKGDVKSAQLLLKSRQDVMSDKQDNLDALLGEFRHKNRILSDDKAVADDDSGEDACGTSSTPAKGKKDDSKV